MGIQPRYPGHRRSRQGCPARRLPVRPGIARERVRGPRQLARASATLEVKDDWWTRGERGSLAPREDLRGILPWCAAGGGHASGDKVDELEPAAAADVSEHRGGRLRVPGE